ncbi:MAG TPA: response regulator transcription factor [Thermoanaerobaculia bacterium]|nr:response regulator transcription factor [Thermoanaerobaculia bacterium]
MRILVVEDNEALARAILELLEGENYAVDRAADGVSAAEMADVNSYDLIVLDWSIPPPSGIELLTLWRQSGKETPVLMLTGKSELDDMISGLDHGADDYLTKPFRFPELLARVRSLLRRQHRQLLTQLAAGDVVMDRAKRTVEVAGKPVTLRPKEFAVLEYLLSRVDEVVSKSELVEHVWDDSFDSFSNVVDVTVHRVRQKIDGEADAPLLETLKGVGYRLKRQRPDLN